VKHGPASVGGGPRWREQHPLGRVVEFDAQAAKLVDDAKVDGLLQVEQRIDARLLHEVRQSNSSAESLSVFKWQRSKRAVG